MGGGGQQSYLYTVKIANFRQILMSSLKKKVTAKMVSLMLCLVIPYQTGVSHNCAQLFSNEYFPCGKIDEPYDKHCSLKEMQALGIGMYFNNNH